MHSMSEHATPAPADKTGAEKSGDARFKKVRKAIKDRDISEVSWELLDICIGDLEAHGELRHLGKTGLMELLRVISVQKSDSTIAARMEKASELREWLRKAA